MAWPTPADRKVWCFLGDGEMDEPESMGALTMPVREKLDNLIFRDQLQPAAAGRSGARERQDRSGTRGRVPRRRLGSDQSALGFGNWDPLLARDKDGYLQRVMEECVDGEYQNFKALGGAYTRVSTSSATAIRKTERDWSPTCRDEEIWRLKSRRARYALKVLRGLSSAQCEHEGRPVVILAKTVKGFGHGRGGVRAR